METYLTLMYITLDQEIALKELFFHKGWTYCKIDLTSTTDVVGPATDSSDCKNIQQRGLETMVDESLCNTDYNDVVVDTNSKELEGNTTDLVDSEEDQIKEQVTEEPIEPTSNCHLCSECGKSFKKPQSLKAHLEMHAVETMGDKRQFVCTAENCGKSFSRKMHWLFHMNIHEKRTPFVCEYCGKSYSSQYSHKRHILVSHTGNGGRCSICGKAILEKAALLAHKAVCYSKSAFRCKQCGAVFKWRSALIRHRKRHETGMVDKRFDMNYVDYSEKHTDSLPISATKTSYQYAGLEKLKPGEGSLESIEMTKVVNTGERELSCTKTNKEYFCKECNKIFKWKQSYSKHKKSKHCKDVPNEMDKVEKFVQESDVKQDIVVYYIQEPEKSVNHTQLC